MKIVVVDDSPSSREWLSEKVADYMQRRGLKYDLICFEYGEDFVDALETERFDIVFMDIYMGEMTGITAAGKLREKDMDCSLVFLTISRDFFQEGYAFNPCHYLVKPVKPEDFEKAMDNCRIKPQVEVPFLSVMSGGIPLNVDTTEIMYVDICNRITTLHMACHTIAVSGSMSKVTDPLTADKRFLTCIQGVLVNMDYIASQEESLFVLKDGQRLPMAVRSKQNLIRQYRAYLFDRMGERRTRL